MSWNTWWQAAKYLDALVARSLTQNINDTFNDLAQNKVCFLKIQPPCFDFREVQDIINQCKKPIRQDEEKIVLESNASINYLGRILNSETITYFQDYEYMEALGSEDSSGVLTNTPVFKDGTGEEGSHMPWAAYAKMSEDDLRGMHRYLSSLPPVRNDTGAYTQKRD